jgi:hypothetical protein
MKTISEINATLAAFEKRFGHKIIGADQKSEAWFQTKLGVLSASNASKIIAKKDSETRWTYLCEIVAQICTGEQKQIRGEALDWGNQHEDGCRAYYEFDTGHKLTPLSFVFKDDSFREGCSPDALVTDIKGCEIKCPFASENYIKFLLEDDVKGEWEKQIQYTMRVLDAEQWDFAQYDPRMKIKPMHRIFRERDEKMQKTFADAVPQFLHDVDEALAKIGMPFGEQWLRLKAADKVDEAFIHG